MGRERLLAEVLLEGLGISSAILRGNVGIRVLRLVEVGGEVGQLLCEESTLGLACPRVS